MVDASVVPDRTYAFGVCAIDGSTLVVVCLAEISATDVVVTSVVVGSSVVVGPSLVESFIVCVIACPVNCICRTKLNLLT